MGTIVDNDAAPTISINNTSVTEPDTGTTNLVFTVSLSAISGKPVSVNLATANGTATAPADYAALPTTTLTITTGTQTATITVPVNGDIIDEADETLFMNLSNPVNATIADNQGIGTIIDNDAPAGSALVVDTVSDANLTACTAAPNDCSLRGAINNANANAGADTIDFAIPGIVGNVKIITLGSLLPDLTDTVTINGYSQDALTTGGAKENTQLVGNDAVLRIQLNGLDTIGRGFNVIASNVTIKGLVISRFTGDGITLSGNNNQVSGCYIGMNPSGTAALPNGGTGIVITGNNNRIGGAAIAQRNVISGNKFSGVHVKTGATGAVIKGNYIGTNAAGNLDRGNESVGILIEANRNTIGGTTPSERNVASGNEEHGIDILGGTGNIVQGNYVGTNAQGNSDLGNTRTGIRLEANAASNTIGGTLPGAANLVSGNDGAGVVLTDLDTKSNTILGNFIGTTANGLSALSNPIGVLIFSNAQLNTIGGITSGASNLISGNALAGIEIRNANNNRVEGNTIGLNLNGAALSNGAFGDGIQITNGATGNTIGGIVTPARNVISGNNGAGVSINGSPANHVRGNYIGTNAAGSAAIANGRGVRIEGGSQRNVVGGTTAAFRNIISGCEYGVILDDAATTGNAVLGNFIGTNTTGSAAISNRFGVGIFNAVRNTIGGSQSGARNIISGNVDGNIYISENAAANSILGNFIGTNVNGTASLGAFSTTAGVIIDNGANGNVIGGTTAAARNIISGNAGHGILIEGRSFGPGNLARSNRVTGNFVGLNAAGTAKVPNGSDGIIMESGTVNNVIGVPGAFGGNIVSGNGRYGIAMSGTGTDANIVQNNRVGLNPAGNALFGNAQQGIVIHEGAQRNRIGSDVAGTGNVVAGNGHNGIGIGGDGGATSGQNTAFNVVQGNFVGTDATGNLAGFGNALPGIAIAQGAHDNLIGGLTTGARNVVSGNNSDGLFLGNPAARLNRIQGNYIGIKADGSGALPNNGNGITIADNARNNLIGGNGGRNIISGNTQRGVFISGAATANVVQSNFIGTNVAGTAAIGNGFEGVTIDGASGNLIGGAAATARNIISGNQLAGVAILGIARNNALQGNTIGLNATGTTALPNVRQGVFINASNNTVGGVTNTPGSGTGNLISGNTLAGVHLGTLGGVSATSNRVFGNVMGLNAAGTAARPNAQGVLLDGSAKNNFIGTSVTGAANLISGNAQHGIAVNNVGTTGNRLLTNRIFNNGALGIDLNSNGVTANDAGDADGGANNLQNYPALTSATQSAAGQPLVLNGTLSSTNGRTFTVDVFANVAADPTGFGEGQTYLGSFVTGNGAFNRSLNVTGNLAGQFITLTATDNTTGDTSEFSRAVIVTRPAAITVAVNPNTVTLNTGATQTFTSTVTGSTNQNVTWSVDGGAAGGTITAAGLYTAPATPGTYTVRATSVADNTKSGTATVTVTASGGQPLIGWGYNQFGSVGDGSNTNRTSPVAVNVIGNARLIAVGGSHNLAVAGNVLYAWGDNDDGQLGDGTRTSRNEPVAIALPSGIRADALRAIACGWYHSLALTNDGRVLAWGFNKDGQCGVTPDGPRFITAPRIVAGLSNIKQIAGGTLHSLALDNSGKVWAFGNNFYGQLGNGSIENVNATPTIVRNLPIVQAIGAGGGHSVVLLNDGTARAWGWNFYGQLGDGLSGYQSNGEERRSAVPVLVKNIASGAQLSVGYAHNLLLKSDGSLLSWGNNFYGQLGRTTATANDGSARLVTDASGASFDNVQSVSAGSGHNLVIRSDSTIWSWGYNEFGNLGLGHTNNQIAPQKVPNLSNAQAVAAGYAHSIAIARRTGGAVANKPTTYVDATAYVSNSSITLSFSAKLKGIAAGGVRVLVNGADVDVQSSSVNGNVLTVLLPQGALHAGDEVVIAWSQLQTQSGAILAGSSPPITAE